MKVIKFKTIKYQERPLKTTKWGRKNYRTAKATLLSQKNIRDRLKFANIVEESGFLGDGRIDKELIDHTLWTDETMIELHHKRNPATTRFYSDNREKVPKVLTPKFPVKVMFASGFYARGVTQIHAVENKVTVNAKYYREKILPMYLDAMKDPSLFPAKNKIVFMHDGAPIHHSMANMRIPEDNVKTVWGKGVWP